VSKLQLLLNAYLKQTGLGGKVIFACILLLASAQQAQAHHLMSGKLPTNFWEGLITGLAHPIIGLDHFAFIVAIGLLAATKGQGILLPFAFLFAALIGSGLHLLGFSFPALELYVSASVVIFGILLAMKHSPNLGLMIVLGSLAGVFHGYAYAEAIFGAEMTPLLAYLVGFTLIQLGIALLAFLGGRIVLNQVIEQPALPLRFAGFTVAGAGVAFLGSQILDLILPAKPV
jgi:urease accessory protein